MAVADTYAMKVFKASALNIPISHKGTFHFVCSFIAAGAHFFKIEKQLPPAWTGI